MDDTPQSMNVLFLHFCQNRGRVKTGNLYFLKQRVGGHGYSGVLGC